MKGREQKMLLSEQARQAVRMSAKQHGARLGNLETDVNGCPIAENGWHWSLSHKPSYVAGVAAKQPIGIDLEPVRPVDERMYRRVADEKERALSSGDRNRFFFRLWTAKEAAVKKLGGRYPDIFRCRVTALIDDLHLVVSVAGADLHIEHRFFDNHIASLVTNGQVVSWQMGHFDP